MADIILESTLTCPLCGHVKTETMATDACQWFYECTGCHALLKPKPGDCCVFCSYGTVPLRRRPGLCLPGIPLRGPASADFQSCLMP